MKAKAIAGILGLFILGVGVGILGTTFFFDQSTPTPTVSGETLSSTEYKILEDKLQRTKTTVATQKELLAANGNFLDALGEFDLKLSVSPEPSQKSWRPACG